MGGMTKDEILNVITSNTFSGVEAKLKLATWKKI